MTARATPDPRSDRGELLLECTAVDTLLYVGGPAPTAALDYVARAESRRCVAFHPNAAVREIMAGAFAASGVLDVTGDLLTLEPATEVAVFFEPECFDLNLLEALVRRLRVKLVIGEYDSRLQQGDQIYYLLRHAGIRFCIRDLHTRCVLHSAASAGRPDVSIVVPVYNVEAHLDRCLTAMADLRPLRAEIVCVNDGSTDGSLAELQRLSALIPEVVIIDQVNGGSAAARQAGLEAATGEFVGFVDGDDWISPGMFQQLHKNAVLLSADIAVGEYVEEVQESHTSAPVAESLPSVREVSPGVAWVAASEVVRLEPLIGRMLFRRSFLELKHVHFHANVLHFEDVLFNSEVLFHNPTIVSVKGGGKYHRRLDGPGQAATLKEKHAFAYFAMFDELFRVWERIGDKQTEESLRGLQIATHFCVDRLLTEPLRTQYRAKAASDIFGRELMIGPRQIIKRAAATDPNRGAYVAELAKMFRRSTEPR